MAATELAEGTSSKYAKQLHESTAKSFALSRQYDDQAKIVESNKRSLQADTEGVNKRVKAQNELIDANQAEIDAKRASAKNILISVNIVNSSYWWPKFICT